MSSPDLPAWIRRQLRAKDWNQSELAQALGVPRGTVSNWMTRKRVPDPESCDRLADVFGADVDMVLTLAGHRPADIGVDPDDPGQLIVGMAKRINWSKPGRANTMRVMMQLFLDEDREEKGRP